MCCISVDLSRACSIEMITAGWVRVALVMQNQAQNYPQLSLKGIPGTVGFSMEVGGITWQWWGVPGGGINPLLLSLLSVSTCVMLCGHATLN